jgi:hypothetical protein
LLARDFNECLEIFCSHRKLEESGDKFNSHVNEIREKAPTRKDDLLRITLPALVHKSKECHAIPKHGSSRAYKGSAASWKPVLKSNVNDLPYDEPREKWQWSEHLSNLLKNQVRSRQLESLAQLIRGDLILI